ncbi:MAG: FAD-dependent thymidylate synthase [Candidatus Micrarchaeota archaeon]|nr:FAD-dependent thymidylate synthase [Candidatus Micrarchaeota archaeon]
MINKAFGVNYLTENRSVENDKMNRHSNPEVDAIVGKKFKVLENGFVALVDYMGGDDAIVQAARVSYGKGTKTVNDDTGLIRYLMRHRHTTPFEMVEVKFVASMPIYVARQWIRHRTANVNEYSARYSEVPDRFDIPELERIQPQSKSNKQGREGVLPEDVSNAFRNSVDRISKDSYSEYQNALGKGIARETARILLPLNTYTEWYWKIDLHNLFHFLSLRLDPHAQYEIRQYAEVMGDITKKIAPIAYKAFEDYRLGGVSFSSLEQKALANILRGKSPEEAAQTAGLKLFKEDGTRMKSGEGMEFLDKVKKINEL